MTGSNLHHLPAYNPVYESLVRDEDDLVGIVAYGLYKQSKRDWIRRYFDKNGTSPSNDLLMDYVDRYSTADLERFREQAEDMMLRFAEIIVEDRSAAIRQDALIADVINRFNSIEQKVDTNQSMRSNVLANILSNLILGGITLILVASVYLTPSILDIAKRIATWVAGG